MIYTITPNPALDLGGEVDSLVPNEKVYVHRETRFPGGNAINAARIIKKFNQPVIASGFIGGGVGYEMQTLLDREHVRHHFIEIREGTRISVTVLDRKTRQQARLSFPGPRIAKTEVKEMNQWLSRLKAPALLVIGGSIPPGFSAGNLKNWIRIAHSKGIPCIVDCPGQILREVISARPLFLKPNLVEFQELTQKKLHSLPKVVAEAKKWIKGNSCICISSVEGGAVWVNSSGAWWGCTPKIHVKSTVGAGDSMVGAISALAWERSKRSGWDSPLEDAEEFLRWGLAAAAATLTCSGTHLGELEVMKRYVGKIKIRKLEC